MIKNIKEISPYGKTTEKCEKELANKLSEIKISLYKINKTLNIPENTINWRREMKLTRQRVENGKQKF